MRNSMRRALQTAAIVTLLASVAGCASSPSPSEATTRAKVSVERASEAPAQSTDPGVLEDARQKLAESESTARRGDQKSADRLAQQAEVDAQLAAARARAETAEKAAVEVRKSIATLQNEAERPAAPPQTP